MDDNSSNSNQNTYLSQLAERITVLHAEMMKDNADDAGEVYLDKCRTLCRLKEEYKRHTSVYPKLPPFED
jgi:hypothetical protein